MHVSVCVWVWVCVNAFWLCNVITALFNLSERDLSHFHNHHRSSQDSSYYFATGPTQRSQVCVGCSETTSDTPSVSSWAACNSTLGVFARDSYHGEFPQQKCSSGKFPQTLVHCSISSSMIREHDCYSSRETRKKRHQCSCVHLSTKTAAFSPSSHKAIKSGILWPSVRARKWIFICDFGKTRGFPLCVSLLCSVQSWCNHQYWELKIVSAWIQHKEGQTDETCKLLE